MTIAESKWKGLSFGSRPNSFQVGESPGNTENCIAIVKFKIAERKTASKWIFVISSKHICTELFTADIIATVHSKCV